VVGSVLLKYSPRKSELPQATLRPLDGREHEFHKAELPELVDDIRACLGKPLRETLPEPQPV
jgi:hypothetical protein